MAANLISVGEVLWDVIGTEEHLGGAPLNFAAHVSKLGHRCTFISAVGRDARGERALERMRALGLSTEFVSTIREHATGHVSVVLAEGQPTFTIHRPAAYDFAGVDDAQLRKLVDTDPQWIYFGTLAQMSETVRATTRRIVEALPRAKRFYDINLRKDSYNRELIQELLKSASVVKLNDVEVEVLAKLFGEQRYSSLEQFCRTCAERYSLEAVCVTRGEQGCELLLGGDFAACAGYKVNVVDAIGAGDAFAAGLLHAIVEGKSAREAGDLANRIGALVAGRAGAIPQWSVEELQGLSGAR